MVADYKKKTDEELIAIVNKYMGDHPNASRNHIILHAHGNHQRIRDLDKKGLINLPKAQVRPGYLIYNPLGNLIPSGVAYNVLCRPIG